MAPKKQYNKKEAKALLPKLMEFNKLSKAFINLLSQKVEQKEKHVASISLLVSDVTVPIPTNYNINIQTIDMNNTKVKRKGELGYTQTMNWEDDLKRRRRGIVL